MLLLRVETAIRRLTPSSSGELADELIEDELRKFWKGSVSFVRLQTVKMSFQGTANIIIDGNYESSPTFR